MGASVYSGEISGANIFVTEDYLDDSTKLATACMDQVDGDGFFNCIGLFGNSLTISKKGPMSNFSLCSIKIYPGMKIFNKLLSDYK